MRTQGAVEIVDLGPAGGREGDGDRDIFACPALCRAYGGFTEIGDVLTADHDDLRFKIGGVRPHHFDRELAGELQQAVLAHHHSFNWPGFLCISRDCQKPSPALRNRPHRAILRPIQKP